ncbi:TPA_asm: P3 [Passiflora betacytorhabdovirus 1]|nr:TPA_asm: P3 [Passiflora betacytorhabdovirus 1]
MAIVKSSSGPISSVFETIRLKSPKRVIITQQVVKKYLEAPEVIQPYPSILKMIKGGYVSMTEMCMSYQPLFVHTSGDITVSFSDERFTGKLSTSFTVTFPVRMAVDLYFQNFPYSPLSSGPCHGYKWEVNSPDVTHDTTVGVITIMPSFRYSKTIRDPKPISVGTRNSDIVIITRKTNDYVIQMKKTT